MNNTIVTPSSTYSVSGTNLQPKATSTSATDLVSSFKEILSTMMASSSISSGDQSSGAGMGDLMAPLMLMLLEKMLQQQLDPAPADPNSQAAAGVSGSSTLAASHIAQSSPSGRPVGGVLTQNFHPGHNGLDFGIPVGTPIKATMDGKVIQSGWNEQGYGNLVIVENGAYRTYFAHLSSLPVAVGDTVTAGMTVGISGNTGHSTGPHLHYEIRKNNVPIDPTAITLGTAA